MDIYEATEKYGLEKACRMFRVSTHAVITLHPSKVEGIEIGHVSLVCGQYRASEPTMHGSPPHTIDEAIAILKRPFETLDITYEVLTATKSIPLFAKEFVPSKHLNPI